MGLLALSLNHLRSFAGKRKRKNTLILIATGEDVLRCLIYMIIVTSKAKRKKKAIDKQESDLHKQRRKGNNESKSKP